MTQPSLKMGIGDKYTIPYFCMSLNGANDHKRLGIGRKDRSRYTRKMNHIPLSGLSETVDSLGRIFPDKIGSYYTETIIRYTMLLVYVH